MDTFHRRRFQMHFRHDLKNVYFDISLTFVPECWNENKSVLHDVVIKWKHFPRYWPFVRGIHRSPVNSPHKGQWRGALMFSLIWAWITGWVNNREAGDLSRHRGHYDVNVMGSDNGLAPRRRRVIDDPVYLRIYSSKIGWHCTCNTSVRDCTRALIQYKDLILPA